MASPKPVIALVGPTASGKSALSLALAERLGAEIVSLDSSLVYRGMDIGTAKPVAADRARVPHHLIDICEPTDIYSTARFIDDALGCFQDIQARGNPVLLVGGTMLYLKALISGLAELPAADPVLRQALLAEAGQRGWQALHAELAQVDPVAAGRIHPNDPQRLQRALEVWRSTGRTLTDLQRETHTRLEAPLRVIALMPASRVWLHIRIEQRLAQMLEHGLLAEVEQLRLVPGLEPSHPSMRSVGYRQAWAHLAGQCDRAEFEQRTLAATRQLAKRQLTWLRGLALGLVLDCDELSERQMLAGIEAYLRYHPSSR